MALNRRQFIQASAATAAATTLGACSGESVSIDNSLPVGPYNAKSTAEEVTKGIDLTGKTALVTGCTSGIGFETMRVLALRGAHVFGTGRTLEKAEEACALVTGSTTPLALELSDFDSCVACARRGCSRAANWPRSPAWCSWPAPSRAGGWCSASPPA